MVIKIVNKKTGEEITGKFAAIKEGQVFLSSGIMPDNKGGWRGCGKKTAFPEAEVTITADDPAKELKKG